MVYIEMDQDIKDSSFRRRAAIAIQSAWRGVLTRRKTKIMLKGFTELQKLYRQKLQVCNDVNNGKTGKLCLGVKVNSH